MEELKRPEKKRVVVNIGKVSTHGGGGIGGFILLGGALATAAIASAFIFRKKTRGGSPDNSHRNTHIPPSSPAAVNEKDEANEKEQFTFVDADKHSSEITKEIEFKNESQSLVLFEKHGIEINGVAVSDSGTSEQILCSITPKRPENGAISNGGVSHLPAREQKTLLPLEIENTMVHDAKNQPWGEGEAAIDEHGNTEQCKDFEEVEEGGEGRDDREIELMGEIHDVKREDTGESDGNYVPEIDLKYREGTVVPEPGKDGRESSLPEFGSHISKHENVDNDEKQDHSSSEVVEIIHDGETIQQDDDDQHKHNEEYLVLEHEKCNEPDEEIVPHKGEEEKEDRQCEENIEKNGYIDHSTPERRQLGVSGKEEVQILAMNLPELEPISPEEMEVSQDDTVNGEIEVSLCQHKDTEGEVEKNIENEVEDSPVTIDTGIATMKDEEDIIDGKDGDDDLSDEADQNTDGIVDSSMESNLGSDWQAEAIQEPSIETQQQKLANQEIEGKIKEDTTVKRGTYELHPYKIISDNTQITNGRCNSAKSFIERHVADLATLKDHSTNSSMRKTLLVAIPVLSSVSCSWFFGLPFDKFCFVVLLTIVLSKSMLVK